MNLLVDAAQAVETPGTIKICSGTLDATYAAGPRAWIEVDDTGRDTSLATLKRFLEPFFPTQPVAKVTGLALSLAWGIVQKHHGMLEVHGEVGVGKTFRMTLPVKGDHA